MWIKIGIVGVLALVCASLAESAVAQGTSAECFAKGEVDDGGQDCLHEVTDRQLARGTAIPGEMRLDNYPGASEVGMFGFRDVRTRPQDWIIGCQIILRGDGDASSPLGACNGIVAFTLYGNTD